MNFSFDYSYIERDINKANVFLIDAITNYYESVNNNIYLTEATGDSLYVKLKKFFAQIILSMKKFKQDLSLDIEKKYRTEKFSIKIRELREEANKKKNQGVSRVNVMDFWTYKNTYLEMVKKLEKTASKFASVNYKTTEEINIDIEKFNSMIADYEKKLTKIENTTVSKTPKEIIEFADKEVSGQSKVFQTINDCIQSVEKMEKECEFLEKKKELLGADILPKHVGLIRRITHAFSAFIRKHVIKFIAMICIVIG